MKKLIPLSLTMCLLLFGVSQTQAQTAENPWGFTFRTGFSSYNGDLGNSMLELTNEGEGGGTNVMYGMGLSYFMNDAWGISLGANIMSLEKSNTMNDNVYSQRGTSFAANVVNVNLLLRWNFVNTFIAGRESKLNPYVTAGVSGNFVHHASSIDNGVNTISPNDASEVIFAIPFGAGIDYAITDEIVFNLQLLYNRTFSDNLDLFPSDASDIKEGMGTDDLDGVDHDDFFAATVGLTFAFGGVEEEAVKQNKMLESLQSIEGDVDDINNKMDRLIDLNEESLNALEELQEDLKMSDNQMEDLRAKFVRIVNNIQFAFDESYIIEPAKDELQSLVNVMREYKNLGINLEAYADMRGSTEYNQELAAARAQSVKDFLTSRGISASRISTNVYGETEAVYKSSDADNATVWAQNRAVQITLSYNGNGM